MSRLRLALVLAGVALAGLAGPGNAQTLQAVVDPGPHYVQDVVSIRVTARGFDEEPVPDIQQPHPKTGSLSLVNVSPSVSQSISIANGQVSRTREVSHVYQYTYLVERPGPVTIGPFRATQGALEASTTAIRLDVQRMRSSQDIDVIMRLPEGPVYVGQRVPVSLEFAIERGLHESLMGYALNAPLFDQDTRFRFLDPPSPGSQQIQLQTRRGPIELRGRTSQERRDGKNVVVYRLDRIAVPLASGVKRIPAPSITVEEGLRWQRDFFFGRRRATQSRRFKAEGEPGQIEVLPVPRQGRPESFAGAVGAGFTLEVRADRSVVQVGDPISLTFELRGEGLETASLPPLHAEGLLPRSDFRVPEGELPGRIEGEVKHFATTVRVLHADVREVPALAFTWFDPVRGEFRTDRSRPIALSVRAGEVIGAAQVEIDDSEDPAGLERAEDAGARPPPSAGAGRAGERPPPGGRAPVLAGADLAIERDVDRLLAGRGSQLRDAWLPYALYLGFALLVPLAWADRRRRDVDPAVVARRKASEAHLRALREAAGLPPAESADQLARALRALLAAHPEAASRELDTLLGECDARRYAPAGQAAPLAPAVHERALALALAMVEAGR